MAITSISLPEKVSLSRRPVLVKVDSTLLDTPNTVNYLRLAVAGNPSVDETIAISYADVSETFTIQVSADQSGNTLSQQGTLSLAEYGELIAEELRRNYQLFLNFRIEHSSDAEEYVRLYPRSDRSSEFSVENNLSNITDSVLLSESPNYSPFPSVLLLVQKYNAATEAFDELLPHVLPVIDGQVEFDLQQDFQLGPELPPAATIGVGGDYLVPCTENWQAFKLNWAERSGSPARTTALQTEGEIYYAVWGANNFFNQYQTFWSVWQNNGRFSTAAPRRQLVTYEQPVWLYWLGRQARTLEIAGTITRRSGATEDYVRGQIEERVGEMLLLKAGFTQLQLAENESDPAIQYTLYLQNAEGAVSETFTFSLTGRCNDWTRYILFANSLGGCDTVRITGKQITRVESSAQESSRIVTAQTVDAGLGEDFQYDRRSRVNYQGSIGHRSAAYISYLQEMLNSPAAWLVDVSAARFNPILLDTGNVNLLKDDEDLFSLEFSYRHAWEDISLGITDDGNRISLTEAEESDGITDIELGP